MATEAEQHAAEAAVAAAWRDQCGARAGPLEQADVDAIADAAFQTPGVKPTVELIRRIAGGGSPNAIHPKLDAWFRRGREATGVTDVPAELAALWERLQAAAVTAARRELQPMIDALADDRTVLEGARAQLAVDQATLVTERAATAGLVTAMREDFQRLENRNETLQAQLVALQDGVRTAAHVVRETEQQLAISKAAHDQLAGQLRDARRTVGALQDEARTRDDELTATLAALQASEAEAQALHTALAAATAARTVAEGVAEARASELDTARTAVTQHAALLVELEQAAQLAKATATSDLRLREHLTSELARERDALTHARTVTSQTSEALAASQATVAALTRETGRLHALLQEAALAARPATDDSP